MKKVLLFLLVILNFFTQISAQSYKISPTTADTSQTLDVRIVGHFDQNNYTIKFDYRGSNVDITVNSTYVTNDTLVANVTVGKKVFTREYDIVLLKNNSAFEIFWDIFHVNGLPRPIIKSITPNLGRSGDTVSMVIKGENTHFAQAGHNYFKVDNYRLYDSIYIFDKKIVNDTLITLKYAVPGNAFLGDFNVYLRNSIDDWVWVPNGFTIFNPWLSSVTPSKVHKGDSVSFKIIGANTHFSKTIGNEVMIYLFGKDPIAKSSSLKVINDTLIYATAFIPGKIESGIYQFNVFNNIDKKVRTAFNFEILPSYIDSITPRKFKMSELATITVYSRYTHFKKATNFKLNLSNDSSNYQIVPTAYNIINDSVVNLQINIPERIYTDYYTVTLETDFDYKMDLKHCLLINGIPKPLIEDVTPHYGIHLGDTINVSIKGLHTHFLSSKLNVSFVAYGDTILQKNFLKFSVENDTLIDLTMVVSNKEYINYYNLILSDSIDGTLMLNGALLVQNDIYINVKEVNENKYTINIYPNPVNSNVTIEIYSDITSNITIDIFDLSGRNVLTLPCQNLHTGNNKITTNINKLKSGFYVLRFRNLDQNKTEFKTLIKK